VKYYLAAPASQTELLNSYRAASKLALFKQLMLLLLYFVKKLYVLYARLPLQYFTTVQDMYLL
jgi:hypothetical protein